MFSMGFIRKSVQMIYLLLKFAETWQVYLFKETLPKRIFFLSLLNFSDMTKRHVYK